MKTFLVFNLSKGLWGKHIIQDLAFKSAKVVNGNEILIRVVDGISPHKVHVDDLGTVSYECDKYPSVEDFTGEYYDGDIYSLL